MPEPTPPLKSPPPLSFTFDESVSGWNVPGPQWLKANDKTWDAVASGALVFDAQGRVLLIQRAASDSMPNRWEIPGGAVDPEDASVLYGCARELWEETGLVLRHIRRVVPDGIDGRPGAVFTNRTGQRFYCKFSFEVDVAEGQDVRLDPNEHQDFVWATEEMVTKQAVGERKIPLTNSIMVNLLRKAFEMRRSGEGNKVEDVAREP
ncbi:hypothetical protein AK830_g8070 [Neonectria ditissima]|uniref:Nudix hydrolase domain-containing protein n=1 Tax=Neonectria ditissima TaxID=78410 RepID=A0A0P7B8V4_9HYPO|nr:hypothetical protein AK830_g8070 [Neonectria ditissima]